MERLNAVKDQYENQIISTKNPYIGDIFLCLEAFGDSDAKRASITLHNQHTQNLCDARSIYNFTSEQLQKYNHCNVCDGCCNNTKNMISQYYIFRSKKIIQINIFFIILSQLLKQNQLHQLCPHLHHPRTTTTTTTTPCFPNVSNQLKCILISPNLEFIFETLLQC